MRASEALAAALLLVAGGAAAEECAPNVADLRDGDGRLRFTVEVMDTAEARARGLMHRESLPKFSGMLFVYERAQPVAFWMKNTLIPLDMLFFDDAGRLTRIAREAQPLDETPVVGGDAVRYVLEINGGLAETLGIELGAELRHPAIEGAAWACDE
jgi:uncharacterized membrane protein (UPF0127 family)